MSFPYSTPKVTIANGTSLSASFYVGAGELVGIETPAGWTAAAMTFQGSVDNVNFFELLAGDGSTAVSVTTPAANEHISIGEETAVKSEHFRSVIYVKIRSGTSGTPVNQAADRILTVIIKKTLTGGRA